MCLGHKTDQCDCDCADSSSWDPHYKHKITEDLRTIKNNKLRKLPTKGPNYREPQRIIFSEALSEITNDLDTSIEAMALKTKHIASKFKL